MQEILLVNPRKRRATRSKTQRKNPVAKKRRTAAQKAATRKMIAANRKRRKNPVNAKRRNTHKTPVKRRATYATRVPVRRTRRRTSNPQRITARSIQNQLMEAGTGAFGALGLDVIQGYLPIPANLKIGLVGAGVKAMLAIGMGIVASNFRMIRGRTANQMVNGALTVVLHDELKKMTAQFAPGIPLGEYMDNNGMGYYGSGYPAGVMEPGYGGMGSYLPELSTDDMGMEQYGLGMYEGSEPEYIEDMAYT